MNTRHQHPTSSPQTEPPSYSARGTGVNAVNLREAVQTVCSVLDRAEENALVGLTLLLWGTGHLAQAQQSAEVSPSDESPVHHVVTGTLDQLDFNSGKGLLKTDLGKPIFFQIVRPELFRRLSVGQRVTIGVDEQGQAIKVMEIPPVRIPVCRPQQGNSHFPTIR